MVRLTCALVLVLLMTTPSSGQQSLVGTYKVVSLVIEVNGTPRETMGKAPRGYLVFTPTRFFCLITAENRKFRSSVDEKAALFDTMESFAGAYRLEGGKLIQTMDVSWTETLNGKTQVLTYQLSGNRLTTTLGPIPFAKDPSKTVKRREVWEKVE